MKPISSHASHAAANEQARRADNWSSYWRAGALHSCAGSFSGNYEGAVRQFWLRQFERLQPPATVVDLCCVNAPLSLLLIGERLSCLGQGRIEAIDLAQIDPPWLAGLEGGVRKLIRVHSGVSATELPLPDASVDLVMSQFGIEYVGEAAIFEARRVLRPDGRLAAIVHHVDALPVTVGRAELEHIAMVDELALLDLAQKMLEPMARSATAAGRQQLADDAEARQLRGQFNTALQQLSAAIDRKPHPDLLHEVREGLMRALQTAQQAGVAAAVQVLDTMGRSVEDSRLRQRELVDHAMTRRDFSSWASAFGDAQPVIETVDLRPGALAGWAVSFSRVHS